jgi:Xaa-Pro aminopeptidase
MQAVRPGRADYELVAECEAFFRANGVDDNFQIIGVGGVEVKGMAPPSGKRLKRGDMVTTELTPCVDGYYAQICRTLVVGEPTPSRRARMRCGASRWRPASRPVRDGVTAADIAKAENDVFRNTAWAIHHQRVHPRARPRHGPVRRLQAAHPRGRHHADRAGMALIVHPNTYHPVVGYMVLGDGVAVTKDGCEVLTGTPRELFSVAVRNAYMRRGLMGWNAEELPVATLEARLARLRAAMAKAGMDAFVIYTNNTRPSAVAYVTGFTPYWSDALMLVPRTGAPVFATALSKRVSEWIRTTDPLSEIVNTPKPAR